MIEFLRFCDTKSSYRRFYVHGRCRLRPIIRLVPLFECTAFCFSSRTIVTSLLIRVTVLTLHPLLLTEITTGGGPGRSPGGWSRSLGCRRRATQYEVTSLSPSPSVVTVTVRSRQNEGWIDRAVGSWLGIFRLNTRGLWSQYTKWVLAHSI
jgi:hypothetical protein